MRGLGTQKQRHEDFKVARKALKIAIRECKRDIFLKLCDEAKHDPWVQAFKIVTKKVRAGNQSLSDPKALKTIIDALFPCEQTEGMRPKQETTQWSRWRWPQPRRCGKRPSITWSDTPWH